MQFSFTFLQLRGIALVPEPWHDEVEVADLEVIGVSSLQEALRAPSNNQ